MPKPLDLVVMMGPTGTLRAWDSQGTLGRSLAPYRRLQARGMRISFISYGGRSEYAYRPQLGGMRVLPNWIGLPPRVYEHRLHQLHGHRLLGCDLVKAFDMAGLVGCLRAEYAWRMPFVLRAGYLWSALEAVHRPEPRHIKRVKALECSALGRACHVIATSEDIADQLELLSPGVSAKLSVIPQFVDTGLFRPIQAEKKYDLVYVGRIDRQKNLEAMLEAVQRTRLSIAMIGGSTIVSSGIDTDNAVERALMKRFGDMDGRIHWLGNIKNELLPGVISQARAFILVSLAEGLPRAMIEAMACAMPIVGSRIPGIATVLRHGETGWLCETDADSIAAALESLFAKPDLMRRMGEKAREYALTRFSLDEVVAREYDLLHDIAARHPAGSPAKRFVSYLLRKTEQDEHREGTERIESWQNQIRRPR